MPRAADAVGHLRGEREREIPVASGSCGQHLAMHEPAGELGVGCERVERGARVHLRRGYPPPATHRPNAQSD